MHPFAACNIVDLTLCLNEGYPLTWPGLPIFQKRTLNWFERVTGPHGQVLTASEGSFYDQSLSLDEHTGTHVDFPTHVIPASSTGLPHAGPAGDMAGDQYPLANLCGPAAVIDVKGLLDQAPGGVSPLITPEIIEEWEQQHGRLQAGDVALLNSGYTDRYFAKLPAGDRLYTTLTQGDAPGWPAPSAAAMELFHARGVRHVGTSTPSIGAVDDLAAAHVAGLSKGMSFTEMLIHLDELPARGAYYMAFPLKIAAQSGGPVRAVAFVPTT